MFRFHEVREMLRIIAHHSNLSFGSAKILYRKNELYAGADDWRRFLDIALLCLGVGFTLAGIIFFFAYNWDDVPKGLKMGLLEILVIAAALFAMFSKQNPLIRNLSLLAASVLVGVLFSVYGQIYQTGADAYDFFLGWGLAILIWSVCSGFPAHWLLLLLLINFTVWFYFQQVYNKDVTPTYLNFLMFLLNALPLIFFEILHQKRKMPAHSLWMVRTVALAVAVFLTSSICFSIFEKDASGFLSWLAAFVLFPLGIWHARRNKELFYLTIVPICGITILSTLIINIDLGGSGVYGLASLFVILSVMLATHYLIKINRIWHGSK